MAKQIFELQPEISSLRATPKSYMRGRRALRGALFIGAILIVLGLLWTGAQCTFQPRRTEIPTNTPDTPTCTASAPRTQTTPPTAPPRTTVPLPQVAVWLAEGCNGTYAVGDIVTVKFRSDTNGTINIWNYPLGISEGVKVLEQLTTAGETYSISLSLVEPAGGMEMLTADLGSVLVDCAPCIYTVTQRAAVAEAVATLTATSSPTPAPQLEIWLSEGCNRAYRVGDVVYLRYRAEVDGIVEIWDYPPGGGEIMFLEKEIVAGTEYEQEVRIVPPVGAGERVVARLRGTDIAAECQFSVEEAAR